MQYRRLGQSALKLSALSYGSWITFGTTLDDKGARECLACAYDLGVNFFDSAEVYLGGEAERMLGRSIKQLGWSRDSYCVSSKVLFGTGDNHNPDALMRPTQQGLSRKHIVEACEQSLQRFGLDYLDLYLCHRPDPDMSLPEIAWTMHHLIQQGKILYWGTCEWPAEQIKALLDFCRANLLVPPQVEQPQYNLFHRGRVEQEYQPLVAEYGLGLTTWSPLASGVLAGRYDQGITPGSRLTTEGFGWLQGFVFEDRQQAMLDVSRRLQGIADDLGITRAQLAIAWALLNPSVSTVMLGASSVAQLTENLASVEHVPRLTGQVREAIEQAIA